MEKTTQPAGLFATGHLSTLISRLRSTRALPYLALFSGTLALSLSGLFIHWAQAPGTVTSFYRMTFASLILLPFIARRTRAQGLPSGRILLLPILAGLFVALDHGFWSTAMDYTQIGTATLINNIAPLWVALFAAIFWRERLTPGFWAGLALVIAGVSVVFGNDLLHRPHFSGGDFLALLSSFAYTAYYLVTQRARQTLDTLPYVWTATTAAAFFLMIGSLLLGKSLTGYSPLSYLIFLLAALISQVIGYFSVVYSLGHLPASLVAPSMIAQPVLTALLAIPFAGETLMPGQWIGGLAVLGGIYLVNHSRNQAGGAALD